MAKSIQSTLDSEEYQQTLNATKIYTTKNEGIGLSRTDVVVQSSLENFKVVIAQNNSLIHLVTTLARRVNDQRDWITTLEQKVDRLTLAVEKGKTPEVALPDDILEGLIDRFSGIAIKGGSGQKKKIQTSQSYHVKKDPYEILREEQAKLKEKK
ncbi:ORF2 [Birch leaf roll-associated virus]|uniref:ORF2 n=1 Tax=Birch leaf roll-associated virus TaxID=2057979 RepID=A0A2L0W0P0_9VIRU|nr:ORF2 [Birch leaf roll-associated virus]